jgi:anti-sigma regulatory factor (Ser/Thr protein kinase)
MVEGTATRGFNERIDGGPAAAGAARDLLTERLGETTSATALHDLLLLTTELVTNAVRHADVDEQRTLGLSVAVDPTRVRVTVVDPGGPTNPQVQDLDITVPGGMGLFLVEQISSSWGVERGSGGSNSVWFEISR